MNEAKQLYNTSEVFEKGAALNNSVEANKAKEEKKSLHFPYIKTKENTTGLDIFNLSEF